VVQSSFAGRYEPDSAFLNSHSKATRRVIANKCFRALAGAAGRQDLCGRSRRRRLQKNRRPTGRRLDLRAQRLTGRTRILQDRAEQFPAFAVEPHHLQLLADAVIGRRGADLDPGKREATSKNSGRMATLQTRPHRRARFRAKDQCGVRLHGGLRHPGNLREALEFVWLPQ
jgi:hypothetical protein